MVSRFTLREPKIGGFVPDPPFGLYDRGVPIFEILRLFMGTVNAYDKRKDQTIILSLNETRIGGNRSSKPELVFDYLFGPGDTGGALDFSFFEKFFSKQRHLNSEFFEKLRSSITLCLVAKKLGRHTESFLYFYRILEHVSLAFPLTYALNESDFSRAHQFLKDLFRNERDGDLAAMKSFIPKIATIGGYERMSFDFNFDDVFAADAKQCMSEVRRCFETDPKIIRFPEDENELTFSVPFIRMNSFIATIRNRMFHDRIGEVNFDLVSTGGSEVISKVIMQEALHWLSQVYAEIVRSLVKREI